MNRSGSSGTGSRACQNGSQAEISFAQCKAVALKGRASTGLGYQSQYINGMKVHFTGVNHGEEKAPYCW